MSFAREVISLLPTLPEHLYGGAEGERRLAREVGGGLADGPPEEAEDEIRNSYSYLVITRLLKPHLDKKDWDNEMRRAYQKEMNRRNENDIRRL